jgi:hypothetical protein
MQVPRTRPQRLASNLDAHEELDRVLHGQAMTFFYRAFHVHDISRR